MARYDDASGSFNLAAALAVDASGNVYVTGRSTDVGWSAYTTVKYTQTSASAAPAGTRPGR